MTEPSILPLINPLLIVSCIYRSFIVLRLTKLILRVFLLIIRNSALIIPSHWHQTMVHGRWSKIGEADVPSQIQYARKKNGLSFVMTTLSNGRYVRFFIL